MPHSLTNPSTRCTRSRAFVAVDLCELIPGAISGKVILLCGPIGDKPNDCIQHPILQRVSLPCDLHSKITRLLGSNHTIKSAKGE